MATKKVLAKVDSSKNSFLNFHFIRLAQNIIAKTASVVKLSEVNYPTLFQPDVVLNTALSFKSLLPGRKTVIDR